MSNYNLYSKVAGDKDAPPVVFLPGFAGTHDIWDRQFVALQERFRTVFLDTLGFGESPKPDIAYSVEDHVEAIRHTLVGLGINAPHALAGYSMGCLLALAYAHRYPEMVNRLVLLALPLYNSEQEARATVSRSSLFVKWLAMDSPLAHFGCGVMCTLRPVMRKIAPAFSRDVPPVVARASLEHTWESYSRTLQNVIFKASTAEWLDGLRQPVLVIHGRQDRLAPFENVRRAVAGRPNIELLALPEADHSLIFKHSRSLKEQIENFLKSNQVNRNLT